MAKRKKVPAVIADKRREWLKRNENGETPPSIAKADGYDVRTVRKQITLAKQERERGEARSQVLRNALEDHYRDLVNFAAKIEGNLQHSYDLTETRMPVEYPLWTALREHLPRSPIWTNLNKWEQSKETLKVVMKEVANKMIEWFREKGISSFEEVGISEEELSVFFVGRLPSWSNERSSSLDNIYREERPDGLIDLRYGNYRLFRVSADKVEEMEHVMKGMYPYAKSLPEMEKIKRLETQIQNAADKVGEEITVLKLRRVVPGECRYCPI